MEYQAFFSFQCGGQIRGNQDNLLSLHNFAIGYVRMKILQDTGSKSANRLWLIGSKGTERVVDWCGAAYATVSRQEVMFVSKQWEIVRSHFGADI